MEPTWIANESVVFVHKGGLHSPGTIAVGLPVQIDEFEARCSVALDGLEQIGIQSCGSSPLQALLLGVQHLGYRLYDFQSKGGRVLKPDGSDIPLEAFFGQLFRHPPTTPPEP